MSSGDRQSPKLFSNKPRKSQLKQFQEQHKGKDFSAPSPATASYSMGSQQPPPPPPPPQPPKESFARRYKFLWPLLLGVNFAVGAYLFTRTKKKDGSTAEDVPNEVPTATSVTTTPATGTANLSAAPVTDTISVTPATTESLKLLEPIPESQQRELFKWILEEKRKLKPKDPEEKKRIEEEKAILKEFVKAKSIPNI